MSALWVLPSPASLPCSPPPPQECADQDFSRLGGDRHSPPDCHVCPARLTPTISSKVPQTTLRLENSLKRCRIRWFMFIPGRGCNCEPVRGRDAQGSIWEGSKQSFSLPASPCGTTYAPNMAKPEAHLRFGAQSVFSGLQQWAWLIESLPTYLHLQVPR